MSNTGAESAAPYILYSAATLNAGGAAYETRVVDLANGEQKDPTYLRLNPRPDCRRSILVEFEAPKGAAIWPPCTRRWTATTYL